MKFYKYKQSIKEGIRTSSILASSSLLYLTILHFTFNVTVVDAKINDILIDESQNLMQKRAGGKALYNMDHFEKQMIFFDSRKEKFTTKSYKDDSKNSNDNHLDFISLGTATGLTELTVEIEDREYEEMSNEAYFNRDNTDDIDINLFDFKDEKNRLNLPVKTFENDLTDLQQDIIANILVTNINTYIASDEVQNTKFKIDGCNQESDINHLKLCKLAVIKNAAGTATINEVTGVGSVYMKEDEFDIISADITKGITHMNMTATAAAIIPVSGAKVTFKTSLYTKKSTFTFGKNNKYLFHIECTNHPELGGTILQITKVEDIHVKYCTKNSLPYGTQTIFGPLAPYIDKEIKKIVQKELDNQIIPELNALLAKQPLHF